MHDLAVQTTTPQQTFSIAELRELSSEFSKCGLFAVKSPEQAFALMMLCQSEGIHAVQAMKRYHLIEDRNGKVTPSMRADAMQSDFQSKGGKVEWIRTDDEECAAKFSHPIHQPTPLEIRRTFKRYADNGIATVWKDGKQVVKDNWKKSPDAMLRARVISAGVRAVLPGVVTGIYTPEEVRDFEEDASPKTATPSAPITPRSQPPVVQGKPKPSAPPPAATPADFTPVSASVSTPAQDPVVSPAAQAPGATETYAEQDGANIPDSAHVDDKKRQDIPPAILDLLNAEIPTETPKQRQLMTMLGIEIAIRDKALAEALKADWRNAANGDVRIELITKAKASLKELCA